MKMPFGRLMELVDALTPEDEALPMGALAERWGEPVGRIMDAVDALKVVRGEPSYIPAGKPPAENDCTTEGRRCPMCENPDRCCTVWAHGHHVTPHRGCMLR